MVSDFERERRRRAQKRALRRASADQASWGLNDAQFRSRFRQLFRRYLDRP